MQQPTTSEPERVRGIFQLIDGGYYKVNVCPIPECQATVRKLVGEPQHQHGYFTRYSMKLVNSLPSYVIERYVRVLNLWRTKRHMHTLFELCLHKVTQHTSQLSLPLNKVIHRVFRRMLSAFNEAILYEASHCSGRIFEQYSRPDFTLLQGWMRRGEYLQRKRCPLHRLTARLQHWGDVHNDPGSGPGHTPDYPNNRIDYFVRCTCDGYVDIKPTSISESQARSQMLLMNAINDKCTCPECTVAPTSITSPAKKVSKAKLQADRAERKNRDRRR